MTDFVSEYRPVCCFLNHSATDAKLWCDLPRIHQYPVAKSQCLAHLREYASAFGKRRQGM